MKCLSMYRERDEIEKSFKALKNEIDILPEELRNVLKDQMLDAADNLEFEKAAAIRDQMIDIEKKIEVLRKKKK